MEKQKHTPGPWKINGAWVQSGGSSGVSIYGVTARHGHYVLDENDKPVLTPGVSDPIASVYTPEGGAGLANARLISVAPEMLAILCSITDSTGWLGCDEEMYKAVRAAIARATAEQA